MSTESHQPPRQNQEEVTTDVVERIARKLAALGVGVPAIFYLEMTRPMSVIQGSFLTFMGPFVGDFFGPRQYHEVCDLLTHRDGVERLINALEAELERLEKRRKPSAEAQGEDQDEASRKES